MNIFDQLTRPRTKTRKLVNVPSVQRQRVQPPPLPSIPPKEPKGVYAAPEPFSEGKASSARPSKTTAIARRDSSGDILPRGVHVNPPNEGATIRIEETRHLQVESIRDLVEAVKEFRPGDVIIPAFAGKTQIPTWNTRVAIEEGLKASSYVYACIESISEAVSMIPWYVEVERRAGEWERDDSHALNAFLDRPNTEWTFSDLKKRAMQALLVSGNALIDIVRDSSGMPLELWSLNPAGWRPIPAGRSGYIQAYEYVNDGARKYYARAENMIHIMLPDPSNVYWGFTPMQAAAAPIDIDRETALWNKSLTANMMIPSGVFVFDANVKEDQVEAARDYIGERYQDSINARRPLFLGNGARYQQLSVSPSDLDWIRGRELNAEEIAAVFRVPPSQIGLLRKASYANYDRAEQLYWRYNLIPADARLAQHMTRRLTDGSARFTQDKDMIEALVADMVKRLEAAKHLQELGYPVNVINRRLRLGMPEIEGGDVPLVPANMVPLASVIAGMGKGEL